MKITLISTSTFPSDQGIRTISAVLKKAGHEVSLVFMTASEDYSKFYETSELKQLFQFCKGSDMIGVNSFASTAKRAAQVIDFLKPLDIPLVWGGIHATISPEDCIKYCDIVCVGEAEEAVVELASAIEKNKKIELRPRYDYFRFIRLLVDSEFLITDGGSNQEESFYLGKPCLVMRKTSERKEGLGLNVVISKYSSINLILS